MVWVVVDVPPLFVPDSSDDNDTIDDDNDIDVVVDAAAIAVMIISFGCLPFVVYVLFTESWCCSGPNELFWLCIAVISLWLLVCGSINADDFIVWLADSIGDNVINIITLFFRIRTRFSLRSPAGADLVALFRLFRTDRCDYIN